MFRLSKKVDYAIILLSHLGRTGASASAQDIAAAYGLPQPMVANILKNLATAKIIISKRGQGGGYSLERSPHEITLAQIIQVMDTTFELVECVHDECTCMTHELCPTRGALCAIHNQLNAFIHSVTLAAIIDPANSNSFSKSPAYEVTNLS